MLGVLLLAAALDGEAALRHASALAALGPHPWGSPRTRAAAEYVAVQFREAGLSEVRLQEFETQGTAGANVVGVLRARGPELLVVSAHHDTAPEAPGAYDDGGGVGVLVELARVLARERQRTRTVVFVSFDGEEAWSTGKTTTAGSRAWLKSMGAEARNIVAALAIEMCGWKEGTPVLHPLPYRDPREAGRSVVTPAWLVRAALDGAGSSLRVGDPLLAWIYQPGVRTYRAGLYGDDLSFLQAGVPAVMLSDSSFSAFYPWYHRPGDTADKIDAASLARMGEAALGVMRTLDRVPRGPAEEPHWFSVFGWVFGRSVLVGLGLVSLVPGLRAALRARGLTLGARVLHALLFGLLLWRHPVPALWIFLLANLLTPGGGPGRKILALLPPVALVVLGISAWRRGMIEGLWLAPWEVAIAAFALALLFVRAPAAGGRKTGRRKRV
jgi:Peptidase family M28